MITLQLGWLQVCTEDQNEDWVLKMGVFWPVITENSCSNVLMTTEYSWVNMLMDTVAGVFPSQDGL